MAATSLIQTDSPSRFEGLVLASGIGLASYTLANATVAKPVLRLVVGGIRAPRNVAA